MWEKDSYPTYCSGLAYILTPHAVTSTLAVAPCTSFFWVDDVYMTGILVEKTGIPHHTIESRYMFDIQKFQAMYANSTVTGGIQKMLIFVHVYPDQNRLFPLWKNITIHAKKYPQWMLPMST